MHFVAQIGIWFTITLHSAHGNIECDVLARTESGAICGVRRWGENGTKYASFLNVPYAQQPLGHLRFKELQPLEPYDYIYNATTEGPVCPQHDRFFGKMFRPHCMDEACIHANIYAPLADCDQKPDNFGLPILVFIHSGGFQSGSGDRDINGPEYLVSKNVIVITCNYRLNVFGFLSLNTPSIPGNQGLRDMVYCLRWVQRNARAFGGDPDNVTLAGQSAGAIMAHLLSLSPVCEGLFKRVWLMSGTATSPSLTASPEYAAAMASTFLSRLGINSTDPEEVHRQLICLPHKVIMKAYYDIQETQLLVFIPVVETSFPGITTIIDDEPESLVKKGRGKDIPMVISFTDEEAYSLQSIINSTNLLQTIQQNPVLLAPSRLFYTLPSDSLTEISKRILEKYFIGGITLDKFLFFLSQSTYVYPGIKLAQWRTATGAANTFICQFSYEAERSIVQESLGLHYEGAAHLEDLTFLFRVNSMLGKHHSIPPRNRDDCMRDWMSNFLTNYMRCGYPSYNEEMWPPVESDNIIYQDIRTPRVYRLVELNRQDCEMVEFFDSIMNETNCDSISA